MNDYFQYVHNLKGVSQYDRFKPATRDAIVSVLLRQIESFNTLEKAILDIADKEVLTYISSFVDLKIQTTSVVFTTDSSSYVEKVDFDNIQTIINFRAINTTQHPNKLLRAVNTLLPEGGIYIGRASTYTDRKFNIYKKYGRNLGFLFWMGDFLLNRVIPRIRYLDRLYYYLTHGQFHDISIVEILGRSVYCGFQIIDVKRINDFTYFVVRKEKEPLRITNPSYYAIVAMQRVGQNGKVFSVFKFRTMHPYSEFIQDYMIKMNGYNDKGKPANDYRVTRWGSFMRKLWIDELPQILNVLKGEMKLVGVRPLSRVRYNEFPEEIKCERIKYKPGCIPPYVALNMPDERGNIEAERIYIRDYQKHPYVTDLRYFMKAVYNIVTNKIRST